MAPIYRTLEIPQFDGRIFVELIMSNEDIPFTEFYIKELVLTLRERLRQFSFFRLTIQDVNYATDATGSNGVRQPHYSAQVSNYPKSFGSPFEQWGIVGRGTFPYDFINPENGQNEPGFISINFSGTTKTLICDYSPQKNLTEDNPNDQALTDHINSIIADALHAYNYAPIDGSQAFRQDPRNAIICQNSEALFVKAVTYARIPSM